MIRKGNPALNELGLQEEDGGKLEMNETSNIRVKKTVDELSAIFLILKHAIL